MKRLVFILRLISVLAAVFAVCLLSIWHWKPEWVAKFDVEAKQFYLNRFVDPVEAAIRTLNKDPEAGVVELELALEKFPELFVGDNLFVTRQRALKILAKTHLSLGSTDRALELSEQAYQAEKNHLAGHLLWIDCLLAKATTRSKGREELATLASLFPGQRDIANKNVELLQVEGDQDAEALAAVRFLASPLVNGELKPDIKGHWYGWWSNTTGFSAERRAVLSPKLADSKLRMQFEVPAGQAYVRVDLPRNVALRLKLLSVNGRRSDGPIQIPFDESVRRDNDLDWSGAVLKASRRPDPWFALDVPVELQCEPFRFRLVAQVSAVPEWLGRALNSPAATEEAFRMKRQGQVQIAGEIERIQFSNWIDAGLSHEWQEQNTTTPFEIGPDRASAAFEVAVTVGPDGGVWTLHPEACFQWELSELSVQWAEGDGAPDYSVEQQGMTRGPDDSWRAAVSKPSFAIRFAATEPGAAPRAAVIRGVIR